MSLATIKVLSVDEAEALGAPKVDYLLCYDEFMAASADHRQWCDANKVYYYAAEKEIFDVRTGIDLAREHNCTAVIVENLS